MGKILGNILVYIVAIIIVALSFAVGGALYWGIGKLFVWSFKIDFNWTYWCGLVTHFIIFVLANVFKK